MFSGLDAHYAIAPLPSRSACGSPPAAAPPLGCNLREAPRLGPGQPLFARATVVALGARRLRLLVSPAARLPLTRKPKKGLPRPYGLGAGRQAPPNDDRALGRPILGWGPKFAVGSPTPRRGLGGSGKTAQAPLPRPRYDRKRSGRGPLRSPIAFGAVFAARRAVASTSAPLSLRSQMGSLVPPPSLLAGPACRRGCTVFRKIGFSKPVLI